MEPYLRTSHVPLAAAAVFLAVIFSGCVSKPVSEPSREAVRETPPAGAVPRDVPAEIAAEFRKSTSAWNSGDLDTFMQVYADTATLAQREGFLVGKTLIRMLYAPRFAAGALPDRLAMERLDVEEIAPDLALVRGVYKITGTRAAEARGTTTILMRRIQGRWRIIHDHST